MPIDLTGPFDDRRSIPGASPHDQWQAIAEVEMEAAIGEVIALLEDLYCDGSYVEPPAEEVRRICLEIFEEAFTRLTAPPAKPMPKTRSV